MTWCRVGSRATAATSSKSTATHAAEMAQPIRPMNRCWSPDRRASRCNVARFRARPDPASGLRPSIRSRIRPIPWPPKVASRARSANPVQAKAGRQYVIARPGPPRLAKGQLRLFHPVGTMLGWPREVRSIVQGVRTGVQRRLAQMANTKCGAYSEVCSGANGVGGSMNDQRQPGNGWTLVLRRQPLRIVDCRPEGGYNDDYELVCCECGDDPDLDYREVSTNLQRIRGALPGRGGRAQGIRTARPAAPPDCRIFSSQPAGCGMSRAGRPS